LVEVEFEIFDDLQSIKESGSCNMFDTSSVKALANEKTKNWINENKDMYGRGVMFGFTPITDTI